MATACRESDAVVARLEEQVRELRAALEDAAEGICRIDPEGRVVSINRAFTRLSGTRREESSGAAGRGSSLPPIGRRCGATCGPAGEGRARGSRGHKDGTPFEHADGDRAGGGPLGARPGPKGHYFFIRDLTERRRMENQLIFAGRMAAVGTLAAGVAHEINNPLAYIVANIDFVRHQITTFASRVNRSAAGAATSGTRSTRPGRRWPRRARAPNGCATSCATCGCSPAATRTRAGRSRCAGCSTRRSTSPGTRSGTARAW